MSQKQMEQRLYELYWAQNHPDNPEAPRQFDPMLAKDSTRMSQEEVDSKYSSKTHVIQQKYDGLRCILTLQPGKEPTINTRGRSVKDFAFPDHTGKILGLQGAKVPFKGITVLDGEALAPTPEMTNPRTGVTTKSSLGAINMIFKSVPESKMLQEKYGSATYVAYDILYYDGEDVQDMPYDDREKLIPLAVKQLQDANGNKLPISAAPTYRDYESAYKIFQEHIAKGDEGVMIKDKNLKYTQGARSSGMQKLKGYETIDAFITGSIPSTAGTKYEDLIGGFEFSAYVDGKPRVIAHLSGLTDELRRDATVPGSNPPQLNPDYLNRCAQLRGQEFGKNSLLGSARIDEWRPDKTPEQCQLTSEDIKPKGR